MEERSGKAREAEEHKCEENMKYDGGRKENRDGVRVWIETYMCRVCGRVVDIREEVLD